MAPPEVNYNSVKSLPPDQMRAEVNKLDHDQLLAFIQTMKASPKVKEAVFNAVQARVSEINKLKKAEHKDAIVKSRKELIDLAGKIGEEDVPATPSPAPGAPTPAPEKKAEDLLKGPKALDKEVAKRRLEVKMMVPGLYFVYGKEFKAAGVTISEKEKSNLIALERILGDRNDFTKTKLSALLAVNSREDTRAFFKDDAPNDQDLQAAEVMSLIAKSNESILRSYFDGTDGKAKFEDLTVEDMLRYLEEVLIATAEVGAALSNGDRDKVDMNQLMEKVVTEENLEKRVKDSGGRFKERLKELGGSQPEAFVQNYPRFSEFCSLYPKLLLTGTSDLTAESFKDIGKAFEPEEVAMFVAAANVLRQKFQTPEWRAHLLKYAHGREDFAASITEYLNKQLTLGDAIQIYGYLHNVRGKDGAIPSDMKNVNATSAFLLQMKAAQMVSRQSSALGAKMKAFLFRKGGEVALGVDTSVDLPEGTKKFIGSASEQAAGEGGDWLARNYRAAKEAYMAFREEYRPYSYASDAFLLLSAVQLARLPRAAGRYLYCLRTSWSKIPAIAARYNVDIATATAIRSEAERATGKVSIVNLPKTIYISPGALKRGTNNINDLIKRYRDANPDSKGGAVDVEQEADAEVEAGAKAGSAEPLVKPGVDVGPLPSTATTSSTDTTPKAAPGVDLDAGRTRGGNAELIKALNDGTFNVYKATDTDINTVAKVLGVTVDPNPTAEQKRQVDQALRLRRK